MVLSPFHFVQMSFLHYAITINACRIIKFARLSMASLSTAYLSDLGRLAGNLSPSNFEIETFFFSVVAEYLSPARAPRRQLLHPSSLPQCF